MECLDLVIELGKDEGRWRGRQGRETNFTGHNEGLKAFEVT